MKKSVLLIDTAYPVNGRTEKILNSLQKRYPDYQYNVVAWNRKLDSVSAPDYYYLYQKKSELGNRIKKFLNIFGFKKYVKSVVSMIHPDVIIASHWDSLFTVPYHLKGKSLVIYDNIDIPEGGFVQRHMELIMEKVSIKKSDLIIHASRFFQELYRDIDIKQCVIENKPTLQKKDREDNPVLPLKIAYLGNIRYVDTLTPLIDVVTNDKKFSLDFYGGGPDYETLKTRECENVHFHGPYHYSEVEKFYLSSDLIWAAYPNKDFNVKYAISNKYHESLYFSTPGIFANETKLGDYVAREGIGFIVNPYDYSSVKELLCRVANNTSLINDCRNRIKRVLEHETTWEEDMNQVYSFIEG